MISDNETTQTVEQYQGIFAGMAQAIQQHLDIKGAVDEAKVSEIVDEKIKAARLPQPLEIHLPDGATLTMKDRTHRQFNDLLVLVQEGHPNIMLVGPAGTGKTTLVKHVAKAMNRNFAFISLSAGVTETHIFGRMLPQSDGSWAYVESPFIRIYRNGGVFLFDEVDAADGNVMVSINAALANGMLCNPVTGEVIERHAECLIVTAANTYGRGGDMVYVGRNALDGATLDRFCLSKLLVSYDTDLEKDLAHAALNDEQADRLIEWVSGLRNYIADNRLRRIASTRLVEQSVKALKAGRTMDDVKARFFQDWSADEKAKVGAA